MKIIKTFLFLSLTFFTLGCAATKNTTDIEDVWKPVEYFDELLGEWQTVVLLNDGNELFTIFSYTLDKNKNCMVSMIVDYEPMIEKLFPENKFMKDLFWEYFLGKSEKNEDNERTKYTYGKYFTEVIFFYLSHEDRNKKIPEDIYINQFGNKMKQNNDGVFSIPNEIIFEKVKKPKRRIKDR